MTAARTAGLAAICKKSRGHRTSKIVKSKQGCSNGNLPYHLFILVLSARARCLTWHVIRVGSKDAQKQLARTSLNVAKCPCAEPFYPMNSNGDIQHITCSKSNAPNSGWLTYMYNMKLQDGNTNSP